MVSPARAGSALAMACSRSRVQRPLPEAEEPRARPAGAGDLPRDHGEGAVALTAPLDTVGTDEDRVGDPAPLPHEPRAWLQRDRRRGFNRAAAQRTGGACSSFRAVAVERPPYA